MANVPPQGGRKHPHQEFIQFDTTNVLFICGGAFDGLDKVVQRRIGEKTIGFNSNVENNKMEQAEIMKHVQQEDLLRYGLIPEFIGRLPVLVTLEELSKDALVRIITEPKNALVKQYKKLFDMDHVDLEIQPDAIEAIAEKALERKTGARGLRGIMEKIMTNIMYEVPSRDDVKKCIITRETVEAEQDPELVLAEPKLANAKGQTAETAEERVLGRLFSRLIIYIRSAGGHVNVTLKARQIKEAYYMDEKTKKMIDQHEIDEME